MTAKFEIQVERDSVWLAVLIGMQEASLVPSTRQTGAGEFRLDPSVDRLTGHTVYLRGKGLHELFVPLVVSIRRQLNQRHLQLTIPPAAGSQITLRVPQEHCQVKPIENAHVFASPIPHGTRIEAYGIKGQFDLSWDVPVNEPRARAVFDVANKCTLGMDGDRVQLHIVQTIDPKQGTVASVRVRIPPGFRTISGQQKDVADAKKYTAADVDGSGFIKVGLKPAPSGRAELTWDLEGLHAAGAPIVLRGFDIEGARSEIGDVALIPSEGYHFEVRGRENVRRINGLGAGLAESTYSFTQPFRLELGLEEIRPQFSVEPTIFLRLSEQRAELSSQFHIQIRQGAVRAIAFQWPEWRKQGWTIDDVSENADLVTTDAKDRTAGNTVHFRLSGRLGSDFLFSFRAVRSIPHQGTPFHLTLPVMEATVRPASAVVVADAENVKSTLDPLPETAVRPIAPSGAKRSTCRRRFAACGRSPCASIRPCRRSMRRSPYRSSKSKPNRPPRSKCRKAGCRSRSGFRTTFRTSGWPRRSSCCPSSCAAATCSFTSTAATPNSRRSRPGRPATPIRATWRGSRSSRTASARSTSLPAILCRWPSRRRTKRRPKWRCRSCGRATRPSRRCGSSCGAGRHRGRSHRRKLVAANPADQPRQREYARLDGRRRPHVDPAAVDADRFDGGTRVKIARAFLRSTVDVTGVVQTTAWYRIEGPAPSVVLTLPARSPEPPKFALDGVELKRERIRQARPDSGEFLLEIGGLSPNPERVLTVSYRDPNGSPCGFVSLHRLQAPVFPENTSMGPLVWDVAFPYDQFLFLDPPGFSPEFRWQRQTVLWSRGPTPLAAEAGNWIGTRIRSSDDEGNSYAFSRFGGVPTIVVGSMAQSFVIFIGAGISLLAAFILIKLPVARTPLTLFLFGFAASIAYLWSAETVRLLLQPALFGLLLAVIAAAVEARIQRRRARFLLAAPSAADFVATATSPSSIERAIVVPVADPEAPTISRPGSRSGVQPVSASDLGSGS